MRVRVLFALEAPTDAVEKKGKRKDKQRTSRREVSQACFKTRVYDCGHQWMESQGRCHKVSHARMIRRRLRCQRGNVLLRDKRDSE